MIRKDAVVGFIRTYILFFAIGGGGLIYLCFHYLPFMSALKPFVYRTEPHVTITLIFFILFFSFCRIKVREMRLRLWHAELLLFQIGISFLLSVWLHFNLDSAYLLLVESMIICVITPTAAAATAVAGKLGGNESALTTFTILSNLGTAICLPLCFPLFTQRLQGSFFEQFLVILLKVFPVIVLPLILALLIKACLPPLHRFIITKLRDVSFYLWGMTLSIISCKAIAWVVNSAESAATLWTLFFISLFFTALQFGFGKLCGHLGGQRISAGQGLGQKNMVFALWISLNYLNPTVALVPGCYILWQNVVNAFQLWHREHYLKKCATRGISPYQE